MRDLHKIINLGSGADNRIAEFSPVHTGAGADFHTVFENHTAVMRNQLMPAVDKGVSKTRRANRRVGLNDAEIADFAIVIDRNVGIEPAVGSDYRILADGTIRTNQGTGLATIN